MRGSAYILVIIPPLVMVSSLFVLFSAFDTLAEIVVFSRAAYGYDIDPRLVLFVQTFSFVGIEDGWRNWVAPLFYLIMFSSLLLFQLRTLSIFDSHFRSAILVIGIFSFCSGVSEIVQAFIGREEFEEPGSSAIETLQNSATDILYYPHYAALFSFWPILCVMASLIPLRSVLKVSDFRLSKIGISQNARVPGPDPTGDSKSAGRRGVFAIPQRLARDAALFGILPFLVLAFIGGFYLIHHVAIRPEGDMDFSDPTAGERNLAWDSLIYLTLRFEPLAAEEVGGWIGATFVSLIFLITLVILILGVVQRASRIGAFEVFLESWQASVVAGLVAGISEASVFGFLIYPRYIMDHPDPFASILAGSIADAVRFSCLWGWSSGILVYLSLRNRGPQSRSSH